MKLSEVPFPLLSTEENWVTRLHGKKGTIEKISVRAYGRQFEMSLHIVWEDGSTSNPVFPDECVHVTAKDPNPISLDPWVNHQIKLLDKHRDNFESHRRAL